MEHPIRGAQDQPKLSVQRLGGSSRYQYMIGIIDADLKRCGQKNDDQYAREVLADGESHGCLWLFPSARVEEGLAGKLFGRYAGAKGIAPGWKLGKYEGAVEFCGPASDVPDTSWPRSHQGP